MLLPSDVARLVLGYLQEEGLPATSRAFIHESPNLKEYAEHTAGDGTIPACVFSMFGKGLTAILNEYVAAKAKDSGHEVPLVMTSLWKKLDFTLNQIKSLQNSPAISASQRTRSRIGVANMARQRVLAVASPSGVVCSSVSETSSFISPALTSHSILGHSTPVSYTQSKSATIAGGQQPVQDGSRLLSATRQCHGDSPVQVIVSEHRLASGPVSPGRRKWDTPRKRSGLTGPSGLSKSVTAAGNVTSDSQPEDATNENFPQLVIQNARDRILGDRSLQEKLAENINKILASDALPQIAKAASSAVEPDQSIDEILGLEGEIHMNNDAIHDILEQTESDPAFQALFDLFDYHKTKNAAEDGSNTCIAEDNETAGPSSNVQVFQSNDPAPARRDANTSDATPATAKARPGQERKTRKPTSSTLLKQTILDSNGRTSRIENSSARLLVSHGDQRLAPFAAESGGRKGKQSLIGNSGSVTHMDVDEPLNTPPPPVDSTPTVEPTSKEKWPTRGALSKSESGYLSNEAAPLEETTGPIVDKNNEHQQGNGSNPQTDKTPSSASGDQRVEVQGNSNAGMSRSQTDVFLPARDDLPLPAPSSASLSAAATVPAASSPVSAIATAGVPTAKATTPAPSSSCAPVRVLQSPPASVPATLRKPGDPNNVVSLEIIVSDEQDGDPSSNRAVSSISGDKIPTIYLSSPARLPGCLATPKGSFDEAAQAVSGLQRSEGCASPFVCKPGVVNSSQAQQRYIFQPPVDTSNPSLHGPAASYFLVVPTPDVQARPVLLPAGVSNVQPVPTSQPAVTTAGSALILPSPVKPVVLPVSVVGQNTMGSIQVVSNQLIDVMNPKTVQPTEKVKPKQSTLASKQPSKSGTSKNGTKASNQNVAAKGSSHRRILCFDSKSSEVQSQTSGTTGTLTPVASNASQSTQQTERESSQAGSRTKPAILGSGKSKRRVETVRCPAEPLEGDGQLNGAVSSQTQLKDCGKKTPRKQMHIIHDQEAQNASSTLQSGEVCSDGLHEPNNDKSKAKDACSSGSLSSNSSGNRTDNEEIHRREAAEKAPLKSREGQAERRTSSLETAKVRANKENEMKSSLQDRKQQSAAPASSPSRDFSPPAVVQARPTKAASKTSSLAKQAAEMLQDLKGLGSPPAPVKKPGVSISDHQLLGTERTHGTPSDCQRTPSREKNGKNAEGTPKQPLPPNTPDVPTCSPASEAGSENSINMAAHTLMILSRAAIARTGTPLKDSLRQQEVGERSPASSKSKKRKQSPVRESPPGKRERKRSPSAKDKERKKLIDCFPHDLDVDKFLSSLHYDE